MITHLKTGAVARLLGKSYQNLFALIREHKIPAPEKDCSGDCCWTHEDVERARAALAAAAARRKRVPA